VSLGLGGPLVAFVFIVRRMGNLSAKLRKVFWACFQRITGKIGWVGLAGVDEGEVGGFLLARRASLGVVRRQPIGGRSASTCVLTFGEGENSI
jgi:hypothetical protein